MKKLTLFITILLAASALIARTEHSIIHTMNSLADSIVIAPGDTSAYEILIIETGYESWMATNAKPRWFYSNDYYRNKNLFYVVDWNNRVLETMHQPPFEDRIDYMPNIDYGLEVNYQLYWYFKFIEHKYSIKFSGSGRD